jgi:HPt (histidine-containing phosphotransfer) domain-containing protein
MDDFQKILDELRAAYLASMPEKRDVIVAAWKVNDIKALRAEYHKLKGTGKTYGLEALSILGAKLELLCEQRPATLAEAVPLSLSIFDAIRATGLAGEAFSLERAPGWERLRVLAEGLVP